MQPTEYDLRFVRASIEVLEEYLLSNELYWPVGVSAPAGTPPYPQLTPGALLLALERARARADSAEQRADLADLEEQLDDIRSRWSVAWGKKASQDYSARLKLWRNFIEDYRENRSANVDRYRYEVGRRVQLELLAAYAEDVPLAEMEMLRGLDRLLQAVFVPGEFIWDQALMPGFPPDPYWFLYGDLPAK